MWISKEKILYLKEKYRELHLYLQKKNREKLSVMLIPHSEKKIFNFQISVLKLEITIFTIVLAVLISSFAIISRSGTKHEVQELKLSNIEYKSQRKKIREEIKPLNDLITEFTQLTASMMANAGGKKYIISEAIGGPEELIDFSDTEKEEEANPDDKDDTAPKSGFRLPEEIALLKQGIHNMQLTYEYANYLAGARLY